MSLSKPIWNIIIKQKTIARRKTTTLDLNIEKQPKD